MLIRSRRGWELPDSAATPEALFRDRRRLLKGLGFGAIGVAALPLLGGHASAQDAAGYPFPRNEAYKLDREVTPEKISTTYNNFYEFGTSKQIVRPAQRLVIKPWTVTFDGMVEKPFTLDADELLAKMPREERLYRHRCVEAWSMAVPWSGYPMAELVKLAKPLGSAKYVKMETFVNAEQAPGQRQFWYSWPYVEALTIAEATNELAFIATGVYGKPLPNQMGAPLRLAVPWKYGFKSIKSIVKFSFVEERPVSFWEKLQASEYGFWANVNPAVPHPRWSQATERQIGNDARVPTLIYNGYGEQVAHLYKDLQGERLYL